VLGALAAIPAAGTLQVLLVDWLDHRRVSGGDANGRTSREEAAAVS
jgi:hypothetical protein